MNIEILQGKDIDFERVLEIRQIRANTFGDGNIKPEKRVPFTDEIIFVITEENNQILAVGCLYEKEISFLGKSYIIKGIGSIASVVKGRGYGKVLMESIYTYLQEHKLTGMGFCTRENSAFYKKCNFSIQENGIDNFMIKDKEIYSTWKAFIEADTDVLYIPNTLTNHIREHPKAKVYVSRFW